LANDSGHNYAPNNAKLLKIALVKATNELEDEGAAPQRGLFGGNFRKTENLSKFLIGIFAYFKLF